MKFPSRTLCLQAGGIIFHRSFPRCVWEHRRAHKSCVFVHPCGWTVWPVLVVGLSDLPLWLDCLFPTGQHAVYSWLEVSVPVISQGLLCWFCQCMGMTVTCPCLEEPLPPLSHTTDTLKFRLWISCLFFLLWHCQPPTTHSYDALSKLEDSL